MTTITTAVASQVEAIEIHPGRSRWSGVPRGRRDVTDERLMCFADVRRADTRYQRRVVPGLSPTGRTG